MLNVVQNKYDVKHKSKEIKGLEKITIGRELRKLHNAIRRHVDNSPIRHEIENITGTNGWIIVFLADRRDRDIYQRDIEREFGITRSTASKVLLTVRRGEGSHAYELSAFEYAVRTVQDLHRASRTLLASTPIATHLPRAR